MSAPTSRENSIKSVFTRDNLLELIWRAIQLPGPDLSEAESVLDSLARSGLCIVEGFDTSSTPHPAVRHAVPLVLYFATRADADEFKAIVMEAKPGMVAHEVTS